MPRLSGAGHSCWEQHGTTITLEGGLGNTVGHLWVGASTATTPLAGGHLYIDLAAPWIAIPIRLGGPPSGPGTGSLEVSVFDVSDFQGTPLYLQATLLDPGATGDVSLSNGLATIVR